MIVWVSTDYYIRLLNSYFISDKVKFKERIEISSLHCFGDDFF